MLDLREDGRRFLLVVPKYSDAGRRLPLAVLLHGLGETGDERAGAYAWLERYGLGAAWQRLKRPPLAPSSPRRDLPDDRLAELNRTLADRPFRGLALACPFMPKLAGGADLAAYSAWLERALVPRCRAETPTIAGAAHTYIGGVSLGGWASLELLLRGATTFGAWAGVQSALSASAARAYADRLARLASPVELLLLSSAEDPFRAAHDVFDKALDARGLRRTYRVLPGPHDQAWLREAGTLEALLWLDRLGSRSAP